MLSEVLSCLFVLECLGFAESGSVLDKCTVFYLDKCTIFYLLMLVSYKERTRGESNLLLRPVLDPASEVRFRLWG